MFKKNIKPVLLAGALALATAVSPVLAEQNTTSTTPPTINNGTQSFTVTKTLYYAEGVTFNPNENNISFTVTNPANAATLTIGTIDFLDEGKAIDPILDSTNHKYSITDTASATFTGSFAKVGEYTYTITETVNENNAEMKYGSEVYTIKVRVKNGDNGGFVIDTITAQKSGSQTKSGAVEFVNNYQKNTGTEGNPAFTITKNLEGDYADKVNDIFHFTLTLTAPNPFITSEDEQQSYTATTTSTHIVSNPNSVMFGQTYDIYLGDGDTFTLPTLPAGTQYTVIEKVDNGEDEDFYTPTLTLSNETDSESVSYTNTDNEQNPTDASEATGTGIIRDTGVNSATFTNTYDENGTPLTGVIVNNMPYIALLGASGAGLVVLAASKKRSK